MKKEIKRIGKISLANVVAMFYGIIGFFVACFTFIFSFGSALIYGEGNGSFLGFIFFNIGVAILLGLIVSIITAICGWILGLLIAIFYNMFASRLSGIKIELEDIVEKEEKVEKKKEEKRDIDEPKAKNEEKKEKKLESLI